MCSDLINNFEYPPIHNVIHKQCEQFSDYDNKLIESHNFTETGLKKKHLSVKSLAY